MTRMTGGRTLGGIPLRAVPSREVPSQENDLLTTTSAHLRTWYPDGVPADVPQAARHLCAVWVDYRLPIEDRTPDILALMAMHPRELRLHDRDKDDGSPRDRRR